MLQILLASHAQMHHLEPTPRGVYIAVALEIALMLAAAVFSTLSRH